MTTRVCKFVPLTSPGPKNVIGSGNGERTANSTILIAFDISSILVAIIEVANIIRAPGMPLPYSSHARPLVMGMSSQRPGKKILNGHYDKDSHRNKLFVVFFTATHYFSVLTGNRYL